MFVTKKGKSWLVYDRAWIVWDVLFSKKEADDMRHFIKFCGPNLARFFVAAISEEQDRVDLAEAKKL